MQIVQNLNLKSSHHNKPIVTDVLYLKNSIKKPVVLFCHGYKGFKDWGPWNLMGKVFANNNLFFAKFNFSHNGGTLENPIDFPDLEAFGENTFSKELNDLENVIDWISNHEEYKNEIDTENITLIGHSRGGGIVTIKASENKKITRVITWNGVSDFGARFPQGPNLEDWKAKGVTYIENSRTHQKMPHLYGFYEDFKQNETRFTIKKAVQNLNKQHLIIQSIDDTVVKLIEAENLHTWSSNSTLFLVREANHTLGGKHPWAEDHLPTHLEKAIIKSIEFIKKT